MSCELLAQSGRGANPLLSYLPRGYAAGIFAPRTWDEGACARERAIAGALFADAPVYTTGHHTDEITLELTRIVIALSVFAVGVELPRCVERTFRWS